MVSGHETEVDIQGLSGDCGGAHAACEPPFFAPLVAGCQSPASSRMRFTVFGLTQGTQLLPWANSSAVRRFPHSGCASRIFTTAAAVAGSV
jgi:hypothetical protein